MNDAPTLMLTCAAGLVLGAIFFGGLWWTVRKGLSSKQPALWFFVSLIVRTGVTLTGFYLVSSGRWERLLSCLVGFAMASFLVARLSRSTVPAGEETAHAPHSR